MVGSPLPNLIIGNTITGVLEAGLISYSSNTIIAGNKVSGLQEWRAIGAFHLYHSHDIQLLNNEVTSSRNGILLLFSPDNQIKGNRIAGAQYGVALFGSDSNTIENNTFSMNDRNAVLMSSKDNTLRYNNFSNKQVQAYDSGANVWQANYWDDYSGQDSNGDGFGDSAYVVAGTVADSTPKMSLYPAKPVSVPELVPAEFTAVPWTEEWIREDTVWKNCDKAYDRSLVGVDGGATLTIENCTVTAGQGILVLLVRPGSSLVITNSTLRGDGVNSYVLIRSEKGASLTIRDSKIYYAGDWAGGSGIQLYGDDAVIENNEIVGNYFGVDIRDSTGHRIAGNQISGCVDGIAYSSPMDTQVSVIENNVISGCFYPEFGQVLEINR